MPSSHLRISGVMLAVAFVALELAAVRAILEQPARIAEMLAIGSLPMLNIVAAACLVAYHRPESRPFLRGYAVFGSISVAAYSAWVLAGAGTWYRAIAGILHYLGIIRMRLPHDVRMTAIFFVAVLLILPPHLLFAWAGGRLSRRYKVVVAIDIVRRDTMRVAWDEPADAGARGNLLSRSRSDNRSS